jgi:mono/diheme cytochrome c family protein
MASGAAGAAPGEQLFNDNCAACHLRTGLGAPKAFPALAGDKVALGPPAAAAAVVLNGRGGMPAFKAQLSDADLAEILTYVRGAWGNHAAPLTAAEMTRARGGPAAPAAQRLQAH